MSEPSNWIGVAEAARILGLSRHGVHYFDSVLAPMTRVWRGKSCRRYSAAAVYRLARVRAAGKLERTTIARDAATAEHDE